MFNFIGKDFNFSKDSNVTSEGFQSYVDFLNFFKDLDDKKPILDDLKDLISKHS